MNTTRLQQYVNDLGALPSDVLRAWRSGGAANAWLELRERTVDRASGYGSGIVIETDLTRLTPPRLRTAVEIASYTGPDWHLLGAEVNEGVAAKYTAAVAAGRQCVVAWRDGEILGYSWLSPAVEARFESFTLPLPSDAIYVWHTRVAAQARGLGIASALLRFELERAWEAGYRRSWTVVHPANLPSLRGTAAVGPSRVLGSVTRFRLLSTMRSRYRELASPQPIEALVRS